MLEKPRPVSGVPGFAEGDVSVQDASAQRAAPLLLGHGLPAGARVLDACAAPGGKAAHLLEQSQLVIKVQTFPLDRVAEAHRISEAGHLRGKIVLLP